MVDETKVATKVALVIYENTTQQERTAIADWLLSLNAIAQSSGSKLGKARRAIELTLQSEAIWPTVKLLAGELKQYAQEQPAVPLMVIAVLVTLAPPALVGQALRHWGPPSACPYGFYSAREDHLRETSGAS